jgi:hypothetical protein
MPAKPQATAAQRRPSTCSRSSSAPQAVRMIGPVKPSAEASVTGSSA